MCCCYATVRLADQLSLSFTSGVVFMLIWMNSTQKSRLMKRTPMVMEMKVFMTLFATTRLQLVYHSRDTWPKVDFSLPPTLPLSLPPSLPPSLQPTKTNDADEKKLFVLQELYETEKSFLTVLQLISQDFYSAVCDVVSQEDIDLLFSTAKVSLSPLLSHDLYRISLSCSPPPSCLPLAPVSCSLSAP